MRAWKTVALAEVAESIDYGVTASAVQEPRGPKFLRITDIQDGRVNWDTVPWCECDAQSTDDSRLRSGDIVFARTGATTGKSFLIRECPTDVVFASYLIRVRIGHAADARFISHFFQTPEYWKQVAKGARGVAQPGLNATTLKALSVPLPPLSDQRRIAEVLDQAEALRAKRRGALAHLDTLMESIFVELFGDPTIDSQRWPRAQLIALCSSADDIKCGPFGTQLGKDEYRTEGVPLWGIKSVNAVFELPTREFLEPNTARKLAQYSIEPGDIIMTRKGTVGNCAVYPDRFPLGIMHSDLLRLRVSRQTCHPVFLAHQLHNSRDVERQLELISGGAVMPGVNVTKLKRLEVIIPPLQLQQDFARRVAAVETLKSGYRASLAEMDALFASLQHRAFRGEL
jgi:type I restriction enzyme S subunit